MSTGYLIITSQCNYNPYAYVLFRGSPVMALKRKYVVCQVTVVLLVSAVMVAGCISVQFNPRDILGQKGTPVPTQVPVIVTTAIPATTAVVVTTAIPVTTRTPATTATALPPRTSPATPADAITANLPYGVTISYPRDWILEETGVAVTRDYGRDVVNIANLFSPAIPPWRKMTGPNPDPSDHTILTVDVDDAGVTDFEGYFNRVTVALQDEYGSIDITRHDFQLSISGYKAYRMDFDAKDLRGTYIFTKAGGYVYIFSFSNPTPYSSEVEEIYKSIVISP